MDINVELLFYEVFIVANDKFNMYPTIAEIAGMHVVNQHKLPVLNRTEKNQKSAYPEMIFHFKEKNKKSEQFAQAKV